MTSSDIRFDFSGRTAIVTGAGSGIGAAGGRVRAVAGDVAAAGHAEELVAAARGLGGRFSMAVNNAGIGGPNEPAGDYPPDGWAG